MNIRYVARKALASPPAQALIRFAYPFDATRTVQRGTLRGRTIVVGPNMGVTFVWGLDGAAWDWVYRYVHAGDVVYDVGANAGQSTLHLAEAVGPSGSVVAFEPVPQVFRLLEANVAVNKLAQVITVEGAASDCDGTGEFVFDADYLSIGRLGDSRTMDLPPTPTRTQVRVMRLDSFRKHGWAPPKLLKVDVEGGAESVLAGAHEILSAHRPSMYVELHDPPEQKAVREALQTYKYRATSVDHGTVEDLSSRWVTPVYCEPL
jgi:FkbM family methyltransferase